MTTTHTFVGAGLGLATAAAAPELAPQALLVGGIGGALPDLDLIATHRRSLHFPVGFSLLAVAGIALGIAVPIAATILLATFLVGAAVHCGMDALSGGVGPRPWAMTSEKGVYNHLTGRWIRPRRWVRYAGAPEDFGLAVLAGGTVLTLTTGGARYAVATLLACSAVFTLYRRRLAVLNNGKVR